MIFLGVVRPARLGDGVWFAEIVRKAYFIDLSSYPQWLVVLVATLLAALVIWILIKLMKLALWLLFFAVLVGGLFWSMWLLLN